MSISQPSFQPNFHDANELDRWYDAYTIITKDAVREKAKKRTDLIAADLLDCKHIDICIDRSKKDAKILEMTWSYQIDICQKIQKILSEPKICKKRKKFSPDEINGFLLYMPGDLRDIAADSIVMGFMEDFRADYAEEDPEFAELYDYDGANANDGCEEIMRIINYRYPGQLQRLYNQIRSGTLGSDASTKE